MYILNIANTLKKMTVKELKDFVRENCYKQIEFSKENSYYSMKSQKKKEKKDLLSFTTKLTEKKYLILVKLKNTITLI